MTFTVTLIEEERDELMEALAIAIHERCTSIAEAKPWNDLINKLAELGEEGQ
jgi:hypothetical protein